MDKGINNFLDDYGMIDLAALSPKWHAYGCVYGSETMILNSMQRKVNNQGMNGYGNGHKDCKELKKQK